MKFVNTLATLLISLSYFFCSGQNNALAQPKIFAPGIISTGDYETHPAFSPSGDTIYFLKSLPDGSLYAICVS